ncbi:MAG: hypothetical protein RL653_1320 [Pseudomonadota bacterium]|jgi:hypothetical protein
MDHFHPRPLPVVLLMLLAVGCRDTPSTSSLVPFTPLPRPAEPTASPEAPAAPPVVPAVEATPPKAEMPKPVEVPVSGLEPPTPEELEAWRRWELRSVGPETRLLEGVDSSLEEKRAGVEKAAGELHDGARSEGLSLERALVIRERAWSVLAERSRLLAAKAILSELENAAAEARATGIPDTPDLRRARRHAAEDVERFGRASESRAVYGDAWVDAILRKEARLVEAYRAALQRRSPQP